MIKYYYEKGYGHPSITHRLGWEALEAVLEARDYIAWSINADPEEIVFVHSGTEANNLAILGATKAYKNHGRKIVTSAIEHYSVLLPINYLGENGFNVVSIPVDNEGFVDLDILDSLITKDTILVSIQWVNHEIGTIQPIKDIVDIVKSKNKNTIVHVDAVDAYTKIPIDVEKIPIDLLSISSHKILGPKGAAALYIRRGIKVEKILLGALSTQKLWPGVENVPAIVGFYKAARKAIEDMDSINNYVRTLRDKLFKQILDNIDHVLVNGPLGDKRVVDNVNVSFLYVEGEALTLELSTYGVYVSSGSACTSRVLEPSHVLLAIGRKHEEAHGSILFKLTKYHTVDDIDYTVEVLGKALSRLRSISSIYR